VSDYASIRFYEKSDSNDFFNPDIKK